MSSLRKLIELLEERAQQVRALETRADAVIQERGDQKGYERLMHGKAMLLAELYDETKELAKGLNYTVDARLERFSQSAYAALKIGSVFFMSALLYPEDHRQGAPNDLEIFIEDLKTTAG